MNAEYMISNQPPALQSTLIIPNNFLCMWS